MFNNTKEYSNPCFNLNSERVQSWEVHFAVAYTAKEVEYKWLEGNRAFKCKYKRTNANTNTNTNIQKYINTKIHIYKNTKYKYTKSTAEDITELL